MAAKKKPSLLKELTDYYRKEGQLTIGAHYKGVDLKLEEIVDKNLENPFELAAELARAYYAKVEGHDVAHLKTTEQVVGYLTAQMSQDDYGKFLQKLVEKDISGAYELMRDAHQEHFQANANNVKGQMIKNLSAEQKADLAKKIIAENPDALDLAKPEELFEQLPIYLQVRAQTMDQYKSLRRGKGGKEYSEGVRKTYEQYHPQKK
ncbi:MAG: hypothetical protein V1859_09945 [archaeon]